MLPPSLAQLATASVMTCDIAAVFLADLRDGKDKMMPINTLAIWQFEELLPCDVAATTNCGVKQHRATQTTGDV